MKPRELNLQELQETYGGSDASSTSIGIESSTDTLLSMNYEWNQGDKNYQWKVEAGKDVNADFYVLNQKTE